MTTRTQDQVAASRFAVALEIARPQIAAATRQLVTAIQSVWLAGATVGVEGSEPGRAAGIELAVGLGMRYLVVSTEAKPRYHLAAAMASNLLVTLMAIVQEVLASIDIDRAEAMSILEPLLRGTIDNLLATSPEEADFFVVRGGAYSHSLRFQRSASRTAFLSAPVPCP